MDKNLQIKAEEIHLLRIEVVENKLDARAFQKTEKPRLQMKHRLLHHVEDKRLKIELIFNFSDQNNRELFLLQVDFHYRIENLENFYELTNENIPKFHGMLIATILGIGLSTARGIIFEKLEANGIKNVLIPVIAPKDLLKKQLPN